MFHRATECFVQPGLALQGEICPEMHYFPEEEKKEVIWLGVVRGALFLFQYIEQRVPQGKDDLPL